MALKDQHTDLKSLRTGSGKTADWDMLDKDYVCFSGGGPFLPGGIRYLEPEISP